MERKRILWSNIDKWLRIHNVCNNVITKRIFARVLHIDMKSIDSLNVRNRCVNVLTSNYLYKIQLYGDNIRKDLRNRKLFSVYEQTLMSPLKIQKRIPLTIMMPILRPPANNEEAACYILNKLKEVGHEAVFSVNDYPLLMDGLKILKSCDGGRKISEKFYKFLQEQKGSIIRVGIVHGDFHRDNIMCKDNMPVLIDFDCSRNNDIQAIDALYYILEEVRYMHGCKKTWLDEWLSIYENVNIVYEYRCSEQIDIDLRFGLIILFLERISQQQQYDCHFMKINKNIIKKICRKLINEKYL